MDKKETKKFDAEIGKILQLMIHSLYTNKDIFLRELVSNASDACDKLRYLANIRSNILSEDPNYQIKIYFDKTARTLTVEDNGIGMNKEDLINNLGTIANSGTQKFVKHLTGDSQKDVQLIGQFGVGFYSAFMISDKVKVISCKTGSSEKWCWESDGTDQFTIEQIKDDNLSRGTKVILKLKEGEDDYLDKYRIKHIIETYSNHISIPIKYIDSENESEKNKEEIINSSNAIWVNEPSKVTAEQYKEFYHNVAYAVDDPWMIIHNKNEGALNYINLLFIPTKKPIDLFHPDRMTRVKLYIKKIFITDDEVTLIPAFLRFVRGVIDSEDLPLNISRETLQNNQLVQKIKRSITNKILNELKKRKDNNFTSYCEFWENYGPVLKEGLCEPLEAKDKIMELCLFRSVLKNTWISFDDYIKDMKENQKKIYYLSGDNYEKVKHSPQLEGFIKKDIDVLIFTDNVDDFWVNVERKYKDKEIESVTRAGIDLDGITNQTESEQSSETNNAHVEETEMTKFFTEILKDKVKKVVLSKKLTDSPVCLTVPEGSMDMRMERFLLNQNQLSSASLKILEINPSHMLVKYIEENFKDSEQKDKLSSLVMLLFDQACILDGETLNSPHDFIKMINNYIEKTVKADAA